MSSGNQQPNNSQVGLRELRLQLERERRVTDENIKKEAEGSQLIQSFKLRFLGIEANCKRAHETKLELHQIYNSDPVTYKQLKECQAKNLRRIENIKRSIADMKENDEENSEVIRQMEEDMEMMESEAKSVREEEEQQGATLKQVENDTKDLEKFLAESPSIKTLERQIEDLERSNQQLRSDLVAAEASKENQVLSDLFKVSSTIHGSDDSDDGNSFN